MKFFVLPPTSNMDLMDLGTAGHFCLAHLYVSDPAYKSHFLEIRKRPGSFILLDNGAAEHSLVSSEVLLDIVEELKPDEVIAPDILNNFIGTLANFHDFAREMKSRGLLEHTSLFFCPQGDDMVEWMNSYLFGLVNPNVSTIGLSKIALPHCMFKAKDDTYIAVSRAKTLRALDELGLIRKPLHLLGAETPFEFKMDPAYSKVRSTDSCFSVWAAMNGQDWNLPDVEFNRIPTPHDYFYKPMEAEDIALAKTNIEFLNNIISTVK